MGSWILGAIEASVLRSAAESRVQLRSCWTIGADAGGLDELNKEIKTRYWFTAKAAGDEVLRKAVDVVLLLGSGLLLSIEAAGAAVNLVGLWLTGEVIH